MCKRGDIYYVNFSHLQGSHYQQGRRPAVIVSNDLANLHSYLVTVVPLTSQVKKKKELPTHVFLPQGVIKGLKRSSLVLAEQVSTIDKGLLEEKVACVWDKNWLNKIDRALKVQLGL